MTATAKPAAQPIRDAGTLILIDRSGSEPKVLMGRRHAASPFMPGKFVFPGGRVEAADGRVNVAGVYSPHVERRLQERVRRPTVSRARAYGLAAIRELAEETGILVGDRDSGPFASPGSSWNVFSEAEVFPSLESLTLIARAITPTGRTRRFDARFFAAEASAIGATRDGVVTPDAELVELVWVTLHDARGLDLPNITAAVLRDLAARIDEGLERDLPVPFYPKGSSGLRELI
ncbi:MAG: NUDIX hydrolase [Ancylobacter novellus]|uniref:NUDIX hydrolase n=1 Tax=Ancylobacter novellus TaxID=921 RepID=A0A2W5KJG4_ANCNO|nr:MAG: NUDIX hydrolase [Ancylobacter novellus]